MNSLRLTPKGALLGAALLVVPGGVWFAVSSSAPVVAQDNKQFKVNFRLTRFDQPGGGSQGLPIGWSFNHVARRSDAPHVVDWPTLTLSDGQTLWGKNADEWVTVQPLLENRNSFEQQPDDVTIEPTGQFVRVLTSGNSGLGDSRAQVFTAHRSGRSNNNTVELIGYPVRIQGNEPIRSATLQLGGREVYNRAFTERVESLTLLLPHSQRDQPYLLTVNGQGPVELRPGPAPTVIGEPKDEQRQINVAIPGAGGFRAVTAPADVSAYEKTWADDVAAMRAAKRDELIATLPQPDERKIAKISDFLGIEVPRSPLPFQANFTQYGMSTGFSNAGSRNENFFDHDNPEAYADLLAASGFDRVFEPVSGGYLTGNGYWPKQWNWPANYFDRLYDRTAQHGIKLGLYPTGLEPYNYEVRMATLPWYRPMAYRLLQWNHQRFAVEPNLAGIVAGGEGTGYDPYFGNFGPQANFPWARAMNVWMASPEYQKIGVPANPNWFREGPHSGGWRNKGKLSVRQYQAVYDAYDRLFAGYGLWSEAIKEIDPTFTATTNSYGNGWGQHATGTWSFNPIAQFSDMDEMLAYDWNERETHKPYHLVALADRLRSAYPNKPLHATVDDFTGILGGKARERAYALALTRGVDAIGSNSVPSDAPELTIAKYSGMVEDYRDVSEMVRRMGGVYKQTRPLAKIGIVYDFRQERLRTNLGWGEAESKRHISTDPQVLEKYYREGSHGGKTIEALLACQAAGWPARLVTRQELERGAPADVDALLLVGLNRVDWGQANDWVWYEGVEKEMQAFAARGGKVLLDGESVAPVEAVKTGTNFAPYVIQGPDETLPPLLERNRENGRRLSAALKGVEAPIARSDNERVWAVPSQAGNTQYVTLANWNWGTTEAKNFTRVDPTLDFNWERGAPSQGATQFAPDEFEVVWRGQIQAPEAGQYTMWIRHAVHDNVVMSLDGKEILKSSTHDLHNQRYRPVMVNLEAGKRHNIEVRLTETSGNAATVLLWAKGEVKREDRDKLAVVPASALYASAAPDAPHGLTGTYTQKAGQLVGLTQHVAPATANLTWNTKRPVYNVQTSRRLSAGEASKISFGGAPFEAESVAMLALPAAEPTAPKLAVARQNDGFYQLTPRIIAANNTELTGVPLQIEVSGPGGSATVHSATGLQPRLPLRDGVLPGRYTVKATELLSGQSATATVNVAAQAANLPALNPWLQRNARSVAEFAARKDVPLVIGLTPEQMNDAAMKPELERLERFYRAKGRNVTRQPIELGELVRGTMPYPGFWEFPRWHTQDADLVLLGDVTSNVLLFDQARGLLLPRPIAQSGGVWLTHSPFVARRQVLNLVGNSPAQVRQSVSGVVG